MKNHSPEIDFSFSGKRFSVCRKMINRSHASLFFVKLTDISERTAVRYILSSHTQKAAMTFNTNPVKPRIQLHGIFLPDMLRHPD